MATFLPTFPSLASGAIFIKGFVNNGTGAATAAQYVTFGHCFQKGQIASGGGLEATISGTVYPCQIDVKTSYADGSVCFASISMQVPTIAASTTIWAQFSPASPPGGATLVLGTAIGANTLSLALAATSMPDWTASTAYAQNAMIKPTTGNAGGYTFQFCGTSGASGTTEPTWPQAEGSFITDGTLNNGQEYSGAPSGWVNIGIPFTGTITQDLVAAIKGATPDPWLSGPLAAQGRVILLASNPGSLSSGYLNSALPSALRIVIDATAYADGTVLFDVCVANDSYATLLTNSTAAIVGGTQAYSATFTLNATAQAALGPLVHSSHENWAWQIGTVPHLVSDSRDTTLQVIHNPSDFVEAQAIVPYDWTVGVGIDNNSGGNPSFVTETASAVAVPSFAAPMSVNGNIVNPNMPGVGVSYIFGGIGPNNYFQIWWLETSAQAFVQAGLECARINGTIPWHEWNPNTGRYWSNADQPYLTIRGNWLGQGTPTGQIIPVITADGYWALDWEHYPDLVYLACLMTGRRYFSDEMQGTALYSQRADVDAQSGYQTVVFNQMTFFLSVSPARMQGWGFRHSLYATYVCPDSSPQKQWFRQSIDDGLYWALLNAQFYADYQGESYGWLPASYGNQTEIAPWEDDYALYVILLAATQGHVLARELAYWMLHFRAGVLLNGGSWPPSGYPTADAVIYDLQIWNPLSEIAPGQGGRIYNMWPPARTWTGMEQIARLSSTTADSQAASNTCNCIFTGSISGTTLTVSSVLFGSLAIGMMLFGGAGTNSGVIAPGEPTISGGSGDTWTLSLPGWFNAPSGVVTMSASDYQLAGEYVFWWVGTGSGGGNTDNYDQVLYNALVQGQNIGHPLAASALSALLALKDSTGTVVPNVTSTATWQNALMVKLMQRSINDSQIFPAAGASSSNQGQSLAVLGAIASSVSGTAPPPPPSVWVLPPRRRVYFGNRR